MFSEELKPTKEEQEMLDEYITYMKEEKAKLDDAYNFYKKNSIVPFKQIADCDLFRFDNGDHYHIGYCTVKKVECKDDLKRNIERFEVDKFEGNVNEDFKWLYFEKQKEGDGFYVLIWQTTGYCCDDYKGYLLFPMKDGRYWIVYYCNI